MSLILLLNLVEKLHVIHVVNLIEWNMAFVVA